MTENNIWIELLKLSEQLSAQSSLSRQRDLIKKTVERLMGAKVVLWLSYPAFYLPGMVDEDDLFFSPDDLVRHVIEKNKTVQTGAKAGTIEVVGIPLTVQDELIGVLKVERTLEHPFSVDEVFFLEALSSHSAVSMQVNQQMAVKNWRFEQLALVRSVSFQIANVLDLDELARRVTRLILHTFQFYYVAIFTTENNNDTLHFRASARFFSGENSNTYQPQGYMVRKGEGMVGFVAETGQELLASDVSIEPHFRYIDSLPETQSEISLPLKVENLILGVLDVQSDRLDSFHDMDIMVLRALSDSIALAIEGARLYSTANRRADQISSVVEVSRAITSILDLDALLREVVTLIHKRFGYSFVHIFTIDTDHHKVVYQAGSGSRSETMKAMGITYDIDDPQGIIPWVARNGKPVLANDVSKDERYRPSILSPAETNSELTLPLVFGKDILGVLDIQNNAVGVFTPDDLPLFEAMAANVAISLRNATLYHSESWRRRIAESLRDVAGLVSSTVVLDQVLELILTEMERSLPGDVTAIWLVEDIGKKNADSNFFHLAAIHGCDCDKDKMDNVRELHRETDNWFSRVIQEDSPIIRAPDESLGPIGLTMGFPQDYSSIAVAFRANGQIIGILALADENDSQYGSESKEIIATIADYAAIAIENTRLFASAKEQAWISTVLLQVSEATQSVNSIDDLVAEIIRLTPMLVGIKACAIFFWDDEIRVFRMKKANGFTPDQEAFFIGLPIIPQIVPAFDRMVSSRSGVLVEDLRNDLLMPEDLANSFEGMVLVLFPIETKQDLQGAFLIEYDLENLDPSNTSSREEEQLAVIHGIARQIAIAVENINLLEARQEEAYVTAVLLQVAQAVVGANNLADTLESIVNIMPILIGIDVCVIYLRDGKENLFHPTYIHAGTAVIEDEIRQVSFCPGDLPILDNIWENDAPVITTLDQEGLAQFVNKNAALPEKALNFIQTLQKRSSLLMGFPLSIKGDRFGVLLAAEGNSSKKNQEKRLEIISGIAQQASIAIQNDHLQKEMVGRERLEREIQLAREIQQTFLPASIPEIPGWELDIRWRPARQVGGDFYDFFELPENHLGLVIADVSDKGMPAALYMAVTRTLIRSTIPDIASPARVLEHVNDLLLVNSQNGLFVTAFYAILDIQSGELVFASAGHNPPLHRIAQSESVKRLPRGGAALGALGNKIHLVDHTIQINPEDLLVLFTDGATEAFSPTGEIYGEERLRKIIQTAAGSSAQQILDAIDQSLVDFLEGDLPGDDTTLMAIHRL